MLLRLCNNSANALIRFLMARGPTRFIPIRVCLSATSFYPTLLPLAVAAGGVVLFRSRTIDQLGPISFHPGIPSVLVIPFIMSVTIASAHGEWPAPIIVQCGRVLVARSLSYYLSLHCAISIVGVAYLIVGSDLASAMLRNTLWMTAVAILTTTFVGAEFAWTPIAVLIGIGMLTGADSSIWSLYGILFRSPATVSQLWSASALCMLCVVVAIWNPRSFGYLKRSGSRNRMD